MAILVGMVWFWKDGRTVYEIILTAVGPMIQSISVTKSIVSILAGITLLTRGYIGSVDQKALDFPGLHGKEGRKTIQTITLKNLLTMTALYKFRSAPYTRFFQRGLSDGGPLIYWEEGSRRVNSGIWNR